MDTKTATIREEEKKEMNLHRRSRVKFWKAVSKEAATLPETHINPYIVYWKQELNQTWGN